MIAFSKHTWAIVFIAALVAVFLFDAWLNACTHRKVSSGREPQPLEAQQVVPADLNRLDGLNTTASGGVEGRDTAGDADLLCDGADSHDVGRSLLEPSRSEGARGLRVAHPGGAS